MTNEKIFIIAQGFYGNRTATEINKNEVDSFLSGFLSPELFSERNKTIDRKVVAVPGIDNIVIVYDQNQENENIQEYGEKYITCTIPTIDLKLHSRCFACRIDDKGELQSLEKGDGEKFIGYFPIR